MNRLGILLTLLLWIFVEFYCFKAISLMVANWSKTKKNIAWFIYIVASILLVLIFLNSTWLKYEFTGNMRLFTSTALMAITVGKLVTALFMLLGDLFIGGRWIYSKCIPKRKNNKNENDVTCENPVELREKGHITRSGFLGRVGIATGVVLFGNLVIGVSNRYNYKVRRLKVKMNNLPAAFKGLKIAQLSDIHSGSFDNKQAVLDGVEMLMAEQPDVIFFTGDLVNNIAPEIEPYKDVFNQLSAPFGVYSILGNHDYGDYFKWENEADKVQNLKDLIAHQKDMGWDVLLNEHRVIEKDGEKIAILGVENWGANLRFPRYGDIPKAMEGLDPNIKCQILLSHDPSHWDAQINDQYKNIGLTLSGHTHGMQFGLDLPFLKWSPSQWVYKQWAGLYSNDSNQHIYVNRGYGFLGYQGRVGILPEITIIELE